VFILRIKVLEFLKFGLRNAKIHVKDSIVHYVYQILFILEVFKSLNTQLYKIYLKYKG